MRFMSIQKKASLVIAAVCFACVSQAKVARIWHGKVPNAKAQEYAKYIGDAIKGFTKIKGNQGYVLMADKKSKFTQFMVISYWDAKSSITGYAGNDIEKTHFLPRDKEFLIDPEQSVTNYEIVEDVAPTK